MTLTGLCAIIFFGILTIWGLGISENTQNKYGNLNCLLTLICLLALVVGCFSGINDIIQYEVKHSLSSYYIVNVNCYKENYNQDLRQRRGLFYNSYYTLEDDKSVQIPDDCIITERSKVIGE